MLHSPPWPLLLGVALCGMITLHGPMALAKEPAPSFPWQGEELYFKILVNGSEAGQASVRVGEIRRTKTQSYIPLSARAQSVGFFQTVYPLDDRADTYLDPTTGQPLRSEKLFQEAGKARSYKVNYTPKAFEAKVHKVYLKSPKNPTESARTYSRAIPAQTHDSFTWFFALRGEPTLTEVGSRFTYHIYDGWKLSRLELEVMQKDRVLTPLGWHDVVRVDFSREILHSSSQTLEQKPAAPKLRTLKPATPLGSAWFTVDERRLPVKMNMSSATYGVGEVLLAKYSAPTTALSTKTKTKKKKQK